MRDATLIVLSAIITSISFAILDQIPEQPSAVPVEAWLLVDELAETETVPTPDETRTLFLLIDGPASVE